MQNCTIVCHVRYTVKLSETDPKKTGVYVRLLKETSLAIRGSKIGLGSEKN